MQEDDTQVPTELFLPYMRDVMRCEQSLQSLNQMWQVIEASARMNCPAEAQAILPTLAATRTGFARLESELVASLVQEKVHNVLTELATKAQYVIDIVVRNLYERTADVGFLATDLELCGFVAGLEGHADRDAVHRRLCEYRSKYTVYDEIILLDTQGNVLAQIDPAFPVKHSRDALIAASLHSDRHVETFRATDLRPGQERALAYSQRMLHPGTGAVVGVLCLCFHFEQEMAGIFRSHRDPQARTNMLLLDGNDRVIASADNLWVPTGTQVPVNRSGHARLQMFAGRQYLVRTVVSAGYQSYPGPPGWQGQVMIPVEVAFAGATASVLEQLDPAVADGLLSHAATFCPPLHDIMGAARTVQRIVWNGQVATAGQTGDMLKLRTILDQISETGHRSDAVFTRSIHDLYQTVLASSLRECEFTASLLIDLFDRNLYERANDCRWWALTPALRTTLAQAAPENTDLVRIGEILSHVNRLYTVYTRLFVYDRAGRVVASTCAAGARDAVGLQVEDGLRDRVLRLAGTQDYLVTPFTTTPLYEDQATYVYHAAIPAPDDGAGMVGGIGIVFDAGPEFRNMLRSGLGGRSGVQGFYVDRAGRIVASTDASRPVGTRLELDADMLGLAAGGRLSRVTLHDGQYAIVACCANSGYREFKVSDGYRDDVIAVVFQSFGAVRAQPAAGPARAHALAAGHAPQQDGAEFATFLCGGNLFALPAANVLEAVPWREARPTTAAGRPEQIGVLGLRRPDLGGCFIWVFDLGRLLLGTPSVPADTSQIIVVRHGRHTLGLHIDELHAVPQFQPGQIMASPFAADGAALVTRMVKANQGRLLIQAIDVERLFTALHHGLEVTPLPSRTTLQPEALAA